MSLKRFSTILFTFLLVLLGYLYFGRVELKDIYLNIDTRNKNQTKNQQTQSGYYLYSFEIGNEKKKINREKYDMISRDFFRYKCEKTKRIGGHVSLISRVPNELFRTEGAWFVCFDEGVAPVKDKCKIISFGINTDESFDRVLNTDYGCRVESFDPFIENVFFADIRRKKNLGNQVTIDVNDKWRFHRMGICGIQSIKNVNQLGWMTTFDEIIKYVGLTNQVIDIVKMDIENSEWESLRSINYDYMCKYVKQFMIETHIWKLSPGAAGEFLKLMRKLEKCFLLFRRDTRFYQEFIDGPYGFQKTEFQDPKTYRINLNDFRDETDIIDFVVTFGELYFINENYLK